jgi:hypothetical protein
MTPSGRPSGQKLVGVELTVQVFPLTGYHSKTSPRVFSAPERHVRDWGKGDSGGPRKVV